MSTEHPAESTLSTFFSFQLGRILLSMFSRFWAFLPDLFGYSKQPSLDLGENLSGKKTIVLDLDETLIHTCFSEPRHYDFSLKFKENEQNYQLYIQKRPNVDNFLKELNKYFEICIFTAELYSSLHLIELSYFNDKLFKVFFIFFEQNLT